jgi:hypothetical protein
MPEPTANVITRAQTGAIWFKLVFRAERGHVAKAMPGSNLIMSAYSGLLALTEMTASMNGRAMQREWFGDIANPVKFYPGII